MSVVVVVVVDDVGVGFSIDDMLSRRYIKECPIAIDHSHVRKTTEQLQSTISRSATT